jgi:peptidoglycan hydrolase-like protein with peptidoglycan-binding domain
MTFSLTWLPEILVKAGLKVAEQPGWRTRGRSDMAKVHGVICHHTAGPASGNMPSLGIITNGRPGLNGPLAQLGLGRDGTFFVIAAGRANHAGAGFWKGFTTGNSSFIGIEAENSGVPSDKWPKVQMDAYQRGVAAILQKIGADEGMCCGHKEYALPKGRKPDPLFDMKVFRAAVGAILKGTAAPPKLIPAVDPSSRPTLRRGAEGDLVKDIQAKVGVGQDGDFGPHTEAAVRQFQRDKGLVPDGIVGPASWAELDKS